MTYRTDQDASRPQQPPIPTHPADPAANGDAGKVVGEPALQTPDYNAPPSPGAVKSTGPAADPGVGGSLGEPPRAAPSGADSLPPTGDNGTVTENQGGGDRIAEALQNRP